MNFFHQMKPFNTKNQSFDGSDQCEQHLFLSTIKIR